MRVHVLTHSVVEGDDVEVYGLVTEHLELLNQIGTIEALQIQHGDLDHEGSGAPIIEVDEQEIISSIEVVDEVLVEVELRWLAMQALAAAKALQKARMLAP